MFVIYIKSCWKGLHYVYCVIFPIILKGTSVSFFIVSGQIEI